MWSKKIASVIYSCIARVIRNHHLCALVLSLMGHFALGLAIGNGGSVKSGPGSSQLRSTAVFTVQLKTSYGTQNLSGLTPVVDDKPTDAVLKHHAVRSQSIKSSPTEKTPIIVISGQSEPHYFQSGELTEKPQIVHDDSSNVLLALPGVPAQSAVLRLLINENGDIDRVEIDETFLPEYAERLVTDAFSKIKFRPGKIDDVPVKSQLRIVVELEDVVPVP